MLRLLTTKGGEESVTLGERIKTAREKTGMPPEVLGAKVGCSHTQISYIERGQRYPSPELLFLICKELGLRYKQLLILKEKEQEALRENRRAKKLSALIEMAEGQEKDKQVRE
jgi:transcriptional regulator with XRE-family HTH domain